MASRENHTPEGLHPAPGFSHATVASGGRIAYIAGQVALAPDFSVIGEGDLGAQTEAAMKNVKIALEAVGSDLDHVVRRTIYTTEPTEYEVITAAIEKVQGNQEHPVQTILGVTGLAVPGLLVEIEVTAVMD